MSDFTLNTLVKVDELMESSNFAEAGIFDLLGDNLKSFIKNLCNKVGCTDQPLIEGEVHPSAVIEGQVYVAKGATVGPHSYINGPCYIAAGADIRHAAFIRGSVYVGAKAVVGHTTEVKGSVFFDEAKAGHFAYIGDSILGINVNLGAGTKLANLKLKANEVKYLDPISKKVRPSGLKKFGALIGDKAQTGCNSVLSPGTILMPEALVMPCEHFHGTKMP